MDISGTSLKSIDLGSPSLRRKPFEFSFNLRCEGVPGSAKKIPMSFECQIDRQLGNTLLQSNVMVLNRCGGKRLKPVIQCMLNVFCLSAGRF